MCQGYSDEIDVASALLDLVLQAKIRNIKNRVASFLLGSKLAGRVKICTQPKLPQKIPQEGATPRSPEYLSINSTWIIFLQFRAKFFFN